MDNPEMILEIKRNWRGKIIKIEYKVLEKDEEGKRRLECLELIESIFVSSKEE